MVTAYTTVLPPSALPPIDGVIATAGLAVLFAVLLAALAAFAAMLLQHALVRPARRPAVRIVERPTPRISRDAA
jgi:hypothetical protein